MRGRGLGELKRPVDLHAQLAAGDSLEHLSDHRVDTRVLAQQCAAEEHAAQ